MHASKDVEAFIESAAVDHVEYLAPYEDVEDQGAVRRIPSQRTNCVQ